MDEIVAGTESTTIRYRPALSVTERKSPRSGARVAMICAAAMARPLSPVTRPEITSRCVWAPRDAGPASAMIRLICRAPRDDQADCRAPREGHDKRSSLAGTRVDVAGEETRTIRRRQWHKCVSRIVSTHRPTVVALVTNMPAAMSHVLRVSMDPAYDGCRDFDNRESITIL